MEQLLSQLSTDKNRKNAEVYSIPKYKFNNLDGYRNENDDMVNESL